MLSNAESSKNKRKKGRRIYSLRKLIDVSLGQLLKRSYGNFRWQLVCTYFLKVKPCKIVFGHITELRYIRKTFQNSFGEWRKLTQTLVTGGGGGGGGGPGKTGAFFLPPSHDLHDPSHHSFILCSPSSSHLLLSSVPFYCQNQRWRLHKKTVWSYHFAVVEAKNFSVIPVFTGSTKLTLGDCQLDCTK